MVPVRADGTGDTLARLRAQLAAVSGHRMDSVVPQRQNAVAVTASQKRVEEFLPVPEGLSTVLPGGGLARGSVITVDGARSVLVAVIAEVTASGGFVAVVGMPHLSLHAAAEMGADLSLIATVDAPDADPVEVAAVLLDGIDMVVVGLGGGAVPPSRARAVTARARAKGSTLVIVDGRWPGTRTALHARVAGYRHTPFRLAGHGRIAGLTLAVRVRGRGRPEIVTGMDVVHADDRVRLVAATDSTVATPLDPTPSVSGPVVPTSVVPVPVPVAN